MARGRTVTVMVTVSARRQDSDFDSATGVAAPFESAVTVVTVMPNCRACPAVGGVTGSLELARSLPV